MMVEIMKRVRLDNVALGIILKPTAYIILEEIEGSEVNSIIGESSDLLQ